MKREHFEALQTARAKKVPLVVVTEIKTGKQALVNYKDVKGDLAPSADLAAKARQALKDDLGGMVEGPDGMYFLHVYNPPPRVILVGAVHISQPLAQMAALTGYGVTIVDPRRAFASEDRFPGLEVTTDWPDEALERLAPDTRTAVIMLTHDPKIDDPALEVALKSPAFYVGALGSKKTHAKRVVRLKEMGFDDAAINRIRAPVGIEIEARSPAEIAVSIMAEVTAIRRGHITGAGP